MKASQVIRAALANHYDQCRRSNYGESQTTPFMCHAVEYHLTGDMGNDDHENYQLVEQVNNTFMVIICAGGTSTLCDFLKTYDVEYIDAYNESRSHYSDKCFDLRVRWWFAHIEALESKGL